MIGRLFTRACLWIGLALMSAGGVPSAAWASTQCPAPMAGGNPAGGIEPQVEQLSSIAKKAASDCQLPGSEGFRKAMLCLESLETPEDGAKLGACTAGLAKDEALALHAIAADLVLKRMEDRLRSLQLRRMAGDDFTQDDRRWLKELSGKLGTDVAELIEKKAQAGSKGFLAEAAALGVRVGKAGVGFSKFDFTKLEDPGSRQSRFIDSTFGPGLSQAIRSGEQAVQVGESMILPDKTVMTAGQYQAEVAREMARFQDGLESATQSCRNYTSWSASCRRIWTGLKEGYGFASSKMDPDLAAANPGWVKAVESSRRLGAHFGLERSRLKVLHASMQAAAQEEMLVVAEGNRRTNKIFGAYYGTLGAAAVVATGGFAAGPVLGLTTAGAVKLGCAGVAVSLAVSEGIAAGSAAYGARSLSDFQCRLKERLIDQGLASLQHAPVDAALWMALPFGSSKLASGYASTLGTTETLSAALARTTIAGGFAGLAASHLPAMHGRWSQLEARALELERSGDREGAERLLQEARELKAQATLGTFASSFPLLAEALSVPRRVAPSEPQTKPATQPAVPVRPVVEVPPPARKYVNSLSDFRVHTETHIARVQTLALEVLRQNPSKYSEVPTELAAEFVALHDQSKVNGSLSSSRSRTILEDLYQFYGKSLGPEERARAGALVKELNAIDAEVAQSFFKRKGLLTPEGKPNAVAEKLLEIEKIADLVDRGKSPVSAEEFGRAMDPASDFFAKQAERVRNDAQLSPEQKAAEVAKLEHLAELARGLEREGVYDRTTSGLGYPAIRPQTPQLDQR